MSDGTHRHLAVDLDSLRSAIQHEYEIVAH